MEASHGHRTAMREVAQGSTGEGLGPYRLVKGGTEHGQRLEEGEEWPSRRGRRRQTRKALWVSGGT